jgi:ABC-type phosphate/phosphonate transport system ATPase subunit
MREGRVVFDLPPTQVTRERLQQLYSQFEHELRGETAAFVGEEAPSAAPVVMHCR